MRSAILHQVNAQVSLRSLRAEALVLNDFDARVRSTACQLELGESCSELARFSGKVWAAKDALYGVLCVLPSLLKR